MPARSSTALLLLAASSALACLASAAEVAPSSAASTTAAAATPQQQPRVTNVDLWRRNYVLDNAGGASRTRSNVAVSISCRVAFAGEF